MSKKPILTLTRRIETQLIWILLLYCDISNVGIKIGLTFGWKRSFCLSFTPFFYCFCSLVSSLLTLTLCSPSLCHPSHRTKCMLDNALSPSLCVSPSFVLSLQSLAFLSQLHWLSGARSRRASKRTDFRNLSRRDGVITVLFDPSCSGLCLISDDVVKSVRHAANSMTPNTRDERSSPSFLAFADTLHFLWSLVLPRWQSWL